MEAWTLRSLSRLGTHVYLFPQLNQAREVIWEGMDFSGRPFMSAIPDSIIDHKNEARMTIRLINGSRMVLGGSNNYNALMGSNPVTIIYSEYALHHPLARQHLNPILIQNKGLEFVQSTVRGKNHLYDLHQIVKNNPKYHVEYLDVEHTQKHDGTRIITAEDIAEARRMGMSDEMVRQEFYCDYDVGNQGAYFTRELSDMDQENRFTPLEPIPNLPLHSVWDLGGTDATAGWLFQINGKYIHLLHLLHDTGFGLKHYLELAERYRMEHGLRWGQHYMPHDVKQGHQGWETTESRIQQARKHGWHFQVTPRVNFEDGIESIRYILPLLKICSNNCQIGMRALREYQRTYSELLCRYSDKPLDNWAVHIVDAIRYLAVNYRRLWETPVPSSSYKVNF